MAGIYIHIPFCKSRCKYCDFYSTTLLQRRQAYITALLAEYDTFVPPDGAVPAECASLFAPTEIQTIYLGGGTPSLLEEDDLRRLADRLPFRTAREVTLECNPGDITPRKAAAWRALGINRLSIGIQSFNDTLLQRIGRRHTAAEALAAVQVARDAGFDNISIDLIYGLPTLPHEDGLALLQADIDTALALSVQHLSAYCLSYEDGTPLTRMLRRGEIAETDEDTENRMFDLLSERLTAAGMEHYEVSNYALPGYRSQHNSSYWNGTPYLGLGAAAHSYDGVRRWWNPADLEAYITQSLAHSLVRETECLTADDRYNEAVMLGLRTSEGIPHSLLRRPEEATPYLERGLLRLVGEPPRLVATREGVHILNRIIEDMME